LPADDIVEHVAVARERWVEGERDLVAEFGILAAGENIG
jgi:hypothetical protein